MTEFRCPPTIVIEGTEDPEIICFATNSDSVYRDRFTKKVVVEDPNNGTKQVTVTDSDDDLELIAQVTSLDTLTKSEDLSQFARDLLDRESVTDVNITYCRIYIGLNPVYATVFRAETIADLLQFVAKELYGEVPPSVVALPSAGLEVLPEKKRGFFRRFMKK